MIVAEFTNETNDLTTENLYQWDSYQTLRISGIDFGSVTPRVHFANKKSSEALVVEGNLERAYLYVSIPNSLLTQKYDIVAYVYTNTGLTSKTIKSITIPVIPRLKPSEYYQPTDEDIVQIEAIELEAKAIIDGLTASAYDEAETYKRPNIVYYEHSAYMCKSSSEITGVLPTDTVNWQLICTSDSITSVQFNGTTGKLEITCNSGVYSVDFPTITGDTIEIPNYPANELTEAQVNALKTVPNLGTYQWKGIANVWNEKILPDSSGDYYVTRLGLYAITINRGASSDGSYNQWTNTIFIYVDSLIIPTGKVNWYNATTGDPYVKITDSRRIIPSTGTITSVICLVEIPYEG